MRVARVDELEVAPSTSPISLVGPVVVALEQSRWGLGRPKERARIVKSTGANGVEGRLESVWERIRWGG